MLLQANESTWKRMFTPPFHLIKTKPHFSGAYFDDKFMAFLVTSCIEDPLLFLYG